MTNVILVIHLILALGIIALVLIQRSEGGGLGMGGGGGLATPAGAANALTKVTMIFAGLFFATSLTLAILAGHHGARTKNILEQVEQTKAAPAPVTQTESNPDPKAGADVKKDAAKDVAPNVPLSTE
jgi:preprotein translocase subunit SecG